MDHDHVKALELEIAILKTKLHPWAEHLHTTISVLEARINEILGKETPVHD